MARFTGTEFENSCETDATSNQRRRSKWKSAEQINKLRAEGKCFRCEKRECYAKICPLLPWKGPSHERDAPRPDRPLLGPNNRPLRAKWKTTEQIEKLRREGRCFRCELPNCSTKYCLLLPAINPRFRIRTPSVEMNDAQDKGRRQDCNRDSSDDGDSVEPLMPAGVEKISDMEIATGQESKMNTNPFLVNALVNDLTMVQALVDNGCLCSGIIDEAFAARLSLPRKPISPRALQTAENSSEDKPIVRSITWASIDLDGYVTEKLWLYVVPHSTHKMILGKKWLEDQDAVIHSKEQRLELRKSGGSVYSARRWRQKLGGIKEPKNVTVETLSCLENGVTVCKASLEDINKALRTKPCLKLSEARDRLPDPLKKFARLFSDDSGANSLPPSRGHLDHAINLRHENGRPVQPPWGPLYSMSREELLVLRKTLTELLAKGWIRPSSSPAASPVLFARKPNGGLRFCVDYRGLNAITLPDRYPLPLFKETLRQLSKAKWFTKLDVKSAFHRIRMREGDEWMTAFRCRHGLFEWLVTPFGLANAPATFQRYINEQLRGHLDVNATAYMDDILVYTDGSKDDHWGVVQSILGKLEKAGLYLDIDKCDFLCREVKYLGYIVRAGDSVTVDPAKVKSILEWKAPTSVKGVRSFLGFANFYRCFVDGFSSITAPLTKLTKKDSVWRWGPEENEAFEQLKKIFSTEPVLAQWDPERDTVLEADCSGYALGGCLSQVDKHGRLRPVAYYSKRLSGAEANYPIHDKEMLAIITCLQEWKAELRSVAKPFTILSDHKNLDYFMTKRLLNERQARYYDVLQQFNFILKWRPGNSCERPDALSRRDQDKPHGLNDERTMGRIMQLLPTVNASPVDAKLDGETQPPHLAQGPNNQRSIEPASATIDPAALARISDDDEIQALWNQGVSCDHDWRRARDAVKLGERSFPPEIAQKLTANIAECTVAADSVLRGRENRIWVPDYEPLRTAIMQRTHDSYLAGHPGKDTMVGILLRRWFWPKMRESVRRFIRNCDVCGRTTVWREAKAGFLRSLPIPDRIGSELTIDFITDMPLSQGCTNIMVITDRLSKDVFLFGTKTMEATKCARVFIDRYYRYFGFPRYLTSDRGSDWLGIFWRTFCQLTGITQRLTTAYHPQSNASERANQELYKYLRAFTCYAQDNWMELLPVAQLALNSRPSSAIGGLSPFFLRHGYDLEPLAEPTPISDNNSRHPGRKSAQEYVKRLKDAQDFAQAAMASAQQRNEGNANRFRRQPDKFKVGDKVWLDLRNVKTPQLSKKLAWLHAKYDVIAVPDPLTVELNVPGNIHNRFHVELVKRAGADPFPSQLQDDAQNPAILDDLSEQEYEVDSILRARTVKRGRGSFRQALVKWTGWVEPTWEPIENVADTEALKIFEDIYGPISTNNGPTEKNSGRFVGQAEPHVQITRRERRQRKKSTPGGKQGGL